MPRRTTLLEVRRTERPTPRTVRLVAGGPDLAALPDTPYTDRHVELVLPRRGAPHPGPADVLDLDAVRATLPRAQWPHLRSYTIRALDRTAGELVLDVVLHGAGVAGPWAAAARPGDPVRLLGPRGTYAPDPDAAWHLLVGDESALPAIAAASERVPCGVPVLAVLEVADAAEEQPLVDRGGLRTTWLHRDGGSPDRLLAAVAALPFPPGRVHAFVHGEAAQVRAVRRHLVGERGVPREQLSASAYWRRGRAADGGSASP